MDILFRMSTCRAPLTTLRRLLHVTVTALAAFLVTATPARAHGVGMSELRLRVDRAAIEGEWSIHLNDARDALGFEPGLTGEAAWAAIQSREAELGALVTGGITLTADGHACPLSVTTVPVHWDREQDNVILHVAATSPVPIVRLTLRNELLFETKPDHRAYFSIQDSRVTHVGLLRDELRSVEITINQFRFWPTVAEFTREGARHIWSGLDHLLFLMALLLPAALVRAGDTWTPRPGLWPTAGEVSKVVTAFTLAHSITLGLAFFGILRLRAQWVEVAIAVSVFVAAWNNLRPFLPGRAWVIAFAFGLVHGLGFAGALGSLSLPRNARGIALGSFNIGVEAGQVAIVVLALPLLYLASRRGGYPKFVMGLGSLAIAWLSVLWILERAFGLTLFAGA